MLNANEIRKGMILRMDDKLVQVVEANHRKIGRGGAILDMKIRDISTGATIARTFPATKRYERVRTESRNVQFLYSDSSGYHFMDMETYEEVDLGADLLGDNVRYLTDGLEIEVVTDGESPISTEFPPWVVLEVTETDPGHKGDTASGATKPATTETGLLVQVPLFVNHGDKVRVDTRNGEYQERI